MPIAPPPPPTLIYMHAHVYHNYVVGIISTCTYIRILSFIEGWWPYLRG